MEKYLGEEIVNIKDTPFNGYTKEDWILYYIERNSYIDGSHHKDWLFDQIVRIIKNCPIVIKLAKWSNGYSEYRVNIKDESNEYVEYIESIDDYEKGICP